MWVSSPLHPDELMGTCQRQNCWHVCWQHEAQCQTQTHHQHCFPVSHPCPIPPLPLHSFLPFPPSLAPAFSLLLNLLLHSPAISRLVYSPAQPPPSSKPQALKKGEGGTSASAGRGEVQLQRLDCSPALLVLGCTHHLPGTPFWGSAKCRPSIWLPLRLCGQRPVIYFLIPFAAADPTAHVTRVCSMAAQPAS